MNPSFALDILGCNQVTSSRRKPKRSRRKSLHTSACPCSMLIPVTSVWSCLFRPSMNYPFVKQQVWTFVILVRLKYIFGQNVRDKLIIDTYPRLPWLLAHVPVRMKNIEGVVSTRGRQPVVVQNCSGSSVSRYFSLSPNNSPPKSLYLIFCDCRWPTETKPMETRMSGYRAEYPDHWNILGSISSSGVNEIGFPTLTTSPTCVSYKKRFK
jgi:hypothetical protein